MKFDGIRSLRELSAGKETLLLAIHTLKVINFFFVVALCMLSSIYRQTGVRILFAAARACPVRAFATGRHTSREKVLEGSSSGAQQRPALPLEKAIAQPDLLVLDVTSEMEFSEGMWWSGSCAPQACDHDVGHHPEAINIPTQLIGERIEELGADKTRPILVYCKKGVRAGSGRNTW